MNQGAERTQPGAPARGEWRSVLRPLAFPALLAVALTGAQLAAERRLEFNIAEEGFLWCGAVATAHGDVPLRDFYSYDPGRYYWAAAWAQPFGDGILALRLSAALMQALGLFFGLLSARRAIHSRWLLALAALLLLLWMVPRNKPFEPALAMAAVYCAVLLVERPSGRRHFAAGLFVGLAAFFGKNHGLYAGAALLALILYLHWRRRRRLANAVGGPEEPGALTRPSRLLQGLLAWGAGVLAGTAPLLLMALALPGFLASYLDSIRFFVEAGQTNFALPVPWPWRATVLAPGIGTVLDQHQRLALGFAFLLLPLFCAGAALLLGLGHRRRAAAETAPAPMNEIEGGLAAAGGAGAAPAARVAARPAATASLLLAALPVAACYMHHAFSRADLVHLTESIHPLLLGSLALPSAIAAAVGGGAMIAGSGGSARSGGSAGSAGSGGSIGRGGSGRDGGVPRGAALAAAARLVIVAALAGLTLFVAVPANLLYQRLFPDRPGNRLVPLTVAGEELLLRSRKAALLAAVERVIAAHVPDGEPLLLAPDLPGLYPALGRRAPVWDIYPIWPAPPSRDDRMVAELERHRVPWALIHADYRLDGRPELGFAATHPRVAAFLAARFDRLPAPRLPAGWWLLHRRFP
ncbi:MAG TPA: hypothetical protein VHR45_13780 [Thermoanaerobaculia bacterium]|nr:hypothetical protein [Thermoanaerobaculia bacterium]